MPRVPRTGPASDIAIDTQRLAAAIVSAAELARREAAGGAMIEDEALEEVRELLATFRQWSKDSPGRVRTLFQDRAVQEALARVGVHVTAIELHAPRDRVRDPHGVGSTLCGINGRRHATLVTCKRCLTRMSAGSATGPEGGPGGLK